MTGQRYVTGSFGSWMEWIAGIFSQKSRTLSCLFDTVSAPRKASEACDDGFCRGSKKWDLAGPGLLDSQDLVSTFDAQGAGGLFQQSLASGATSSPGQDQSRQCGRQNPMQIHVP